MNKLLLITTFCFCLTFQAIAQTSTYDIVIKNFPTTGVGFDIVRGSSPVYKWVDVDNPANSSPGNISISGTSFALSFSAGSNLMNGKTVRISISGVTSAKVVNGMANVQKVESWGGIVWTDMKAMFKGHTLLASLPAEAPVFHSSLKDLSEMFLNCSNFDSDISGWATNNIENMSSMFRGARIFNQNISGWNTAKVTNMSNMFNGARAFNQNISTWSTANVTNMNSMFSNADVFNQPIGTWNTAKVTDMARMFSNAKAFNRDLNWNTGLVDKMYEMFNNAEVFNGNISSWNVSNVTDMQSMFNGAKKFNQSIANWSPNKLTNTSNMFLSAEEFNQSFSATWNNTTLLENMTYMFDNASKFNGAVDNINISKVTSLAYVFRATDFNQSLANWNISSITDLSYTFFQARSFNQSLSHWDVSAVTNMNSMFDGALAFNQPLNGWNVSAVTNFSSMFRGCAAFNQPLDNWNVSKGAVWRMFQNASSFNQSLATWHIGGETSMLNHGNMLDGTALSVANYDATLIGWSQKTPIRASITMGALGLKYSAAAQSARDLLTNTTNKWNITDGGVLPVTLLSFDVAKGNNGVQLKWQTAEETSNDYFSIERSVDGKDFTLITKVDTKGNNSTYAYLDRNASAGINYYKLSQTDLDGTVKELGVKAVKFDVSDAIVSVYPNPVVNALNVKSSGTEISDITLYNSNGVKLYNAAVGAHEATLDVKNYQKGIYVLKVNIDGVISTHKVIK
jgi:surface protein